MLEDFRRWLDDEHKLLANASHHAYAFGQANMAQRAIAKFDGELAGASVVELAQAEAEAALTALEELAATTALPPALAALRSALARAVARA